MFALDSNRRYFMCQQPVNMRKGIDELFNLVQSESPLSPMTGTSSCSSPRTGRA